jgi:hypothetical protein
MTFAPRHVRQLSRTWWHPTSQWFLPALLAAAVTARCAILAGKRLVWADELLSWYPVSGSFGVMLGATTDTINSAPPLYFILAWPWTHLLGNSAITLRLFSGLATAAAILLMFAVLRRVYGVLPSILALTVTAVDPNLLCQSEQARFHTVFVAELAFAILIYQKILARRSPSFRLLALNTAIHAGMMLTSYIALFYSTVILAAVLLFSLIRRRNPVRPCLSIVLGWIVLLPWIPVLLTHIEMSKLGWIPVPNLAILRSYFEGYITPDFRFFAKIVLAFAAVATLTTLVWGGRWRLEGFRRREISLLVLLPTLLAVPFAIYMMSFRSGGNSIFHERYLLASVLGWTILLAHVAHRAFLMRHRRDLRDLTLALTAAQIIVTLVFVGDNVRRMVKTARHTVAEAVPADIARDLPGHDPIVIEHVHEFLTWHFYSPERSRYLFVLDPEVGSKEIAGGPLNHAIMGALKRRFPSEFEEVVPNEEFLRTTSSFYVRHSPGYQWSPVRLQQDPAFAIETLPDNLLHVRRKSQ